MKKLVNVVEVEGEGLEALLRGVSNVVWDELHLRREALGSE